MHRIFILVHCWCMLGMASLLAKNRHIYSWAINIMTAFIVCVDTIHVAVTFDLLHHATWLEDDHMSSDFWRENASCRLSCNNSPTAARMTSAMITFTFLYLLLLCSYRGQLQFKFPIHYHFQTVCYCKSILVRRILDFYHDRGYSFMHTFLFQKLAWISTRRTLLKF